MIILLMKLANGDMNKNNSASNMIAGLFLVKASNYSSKDSTRIHDELFLEGIALK